MPKNYVIGFPRIGEQRELKRALENFWGGKCPFEEVDATAKTLKRRHWNYQKEAGIDLVSCNDFSFYDAMLDTAVMLGAIPHRFRDIEDETSRYFAMARGDETRVAMEMTKWFNTNYHYIVPELGGSDTFALNAKKVLAEYNEAKEAGVTPKINLVGPLTFLSLAKSIDGSDRFAHFDSVLAVYEQLFETLGRLGDAIYLQVEEPALVCGPDAKLLSLLKIAYKRLGSVSPKLRVIVSTYFDHAAEAAKVLFHTPVWGIGLDFVHGEENFDALKYLGDKKLIAGVVDGRNVWKNDIDETLALLEKIALVVPKEQIVVSSSCSLLHVPCTLAYEEKLDEEIKSWLSFAVEKLGEIALLTRCFHSETLSDAEQAALEANRAANATRRNSPLIHDAAVARRMEAATKTERDTPYKERIIRQKAALNYPVLATTTIGSFPQTPELRRVRRECKHGTVSQAAYETAIKAYIDECVAFQEEIGLDVLVHGEPERNDMVEYFGEQLKGYAFSQNGWVQSYGSRCVKPPMLYGDVSRPEPMTVAWSVYAQSKTEKIMKGMLTGPVTLLNWSFVRDDLPRSETAKQIALAISDEVDDLQNAGIRIVQVDEAAFKEGYPLRREKVHDYEAWAVACFRLSVSSARAQTQIHTHMCYSDFNDIIGTIEAMDADVISIETARSGNELLKIFRAVGYKQEVGPGVYDIHSPRVPSVGEMVAQINALLEVLPQEQLWINPDCGLKTRKWEEVKPSLTNMVEAVGIVRGSLAAKQSKEAGPTRKTEPAV
jgi:5-methyltetrahydropteroyltriglutamate--homocysteine methyltransferase